VFHRPGLRAPLWVVVALILALGIGTAVSPSATAAGSADLPVPPAPTGLTTFPTQDALGVTWSTDGADSFVLQRRRDDTDPWTAVTSGTFTGGSPFQPWIDTGLSPGDSVQYRVAGVFGGEQGPWSQTTGTRPLSTTSPSADDTLGFIDAGTGQSTVFRSSDPDTRFQKLSHYIGANRVIDGTFTAVADARMGVPAVPGPGEYRDDSSLYDWPNSGDTSMSCTGLHSILRVRDVVYGDDLTPVVFDASWMGWCPDGTTARAEVRLGADPATVSEPALPSLDPASVHLTTYDGHAVSTPVTFTDNGPGAVTVGAISVADDPDSEWSVTSDCPGSTLHTGQTCTVTPTLTTSRAGGRAAHLEISLSDDTGPLAPEALVLSGTGATVPVAPTSPTSYRFLVGDELVWQPGDDGSLPITSYDVGRRAAGSTDDWTVIGSTQGQDPAFLVRAPTDGMEYAVRAVNEVGAGPWGAASQPVPKPGVDNMVVSDRVDPAYNGAPQRLVLLSGSDEADAPNLPSSLPTDYDYRTPAASPGATRLVYARSTTPGGGTDNEYDLFTSPVLDLFGATTPSPTQLTSLPGTERDPQYSPDGTTIAFTHATNNEFYGPLDVDASVWTVPATGGAPVQLMTGAAQPVWSPDGKDLIVVRTSRLRGLVEVPGHGGPPIDLPNTAGAIHPAIGPDGSLAFVSGGDVVVLSPGWTDSHTYPIGTHISGLTYGVDGRLFATASLTHDTVLVVGATDHLADPTTPSGPVAPVIRDTVAPDVQIEHVDQGTGPGTRSISFSHTDSYGPGYAGEGASTPGVARQPATCSVDGGAWTSCTSPLTITGLAEGVHDVRVRVTDESGNVGADERRLAGATSAPSVVVTEPGRASAVLLTPSGKARFAWSVAPQHPTPLLFDLRWQLSSLRDQTRHERSTTATTWSHTLHPGQEVCLSLRAVSAGASSSFAKARCITRPYDDQGLRRSGQWTTHARMHAYGGAYSETRSKGAALTSRRVTATRVSVLVTTCRGCGAVRAYLGRHYLGTLHLSSATRRHVLLRLPALQHDLTGTVRLVTTSRRPVAIDAVAISRS